MNPLSNNQQSPKLDILFILGYPTRKRGGLETAALAFSSTLAKRGHAVSAVFRHDGELIPEYQAFCENVHVLRSARAFASCLITICKLAWRRKLVIYGHHAGWIFAMRLLAFLTNARCVCHLHLPPPEKLNAFARWGLRHTDLLLAVSQATRDAWALIPCVKPSSLRTVPNGVDVVRFCPTANSDAARAEYGIPPDGRVVAYIGRLDRHKGVDVLIRAFGQYQRQHSKQTVRLLIAGSAILDGENYVDQLRELVAEIGAADVRFVGRVADPVKFYHASDLTVLPSLWPEPYGLTLAESMACGVPAIASRIGGMPEILAADLPEQLFEPGDVHGLAHKIDQLVNWRATAPQLGTACRNVAVTKFSLDTCVGRIENEFVSLVGVR